MTHKDFELVADVVATAQYDSGSSPQEVQVGLAMAFADRLAETNPRFDRARFVTAATRNLR
jgi:hypothetical protein